MMDTNLGRQAGTLAVHPTAASALIGIRFRRDCSDTVWAIGIAGHRLRNGGTEAWCLRVFSLFLL